MRKLSDIADIIVGFPFKSASFNVNGNGVRLVRGKNITHLALRWGDDARWWNDFSIDLDKYYLKEGDILIGMDGSLVGKNYARVRANDLPLLLVQRVACIRAKDGTDQDFLWSCISNIQFELYIDAIKTGTSIPHISGKQIAEYPIPCFGYLEQTKIGAVLRSLDDKIELNNKINENLERQAEAIYQKCFGDVDIAKKQGILLDICTYSKDKVAVSKLKANTYFSTENMLPGKSGATEASSLPPTPQTTACHIGDTLVSNIRPYFKKIVYCYNECGCSSDVLCFTPVHSRYAAYLYSTLYADRFFDFMVSGSKGTKMPRGDKQQIMTYPVVLPSDTELEGFNSVVMPFLSQIHNNRNENRQLSLLRDTLLPKLMNGEMI